MEMIQSITHEYAATVKPSGSIHWDLAHKETDVYGNSTTNKRINVSSFVFNRPLFEFIMRLQTNRMKFRLIESSVSRHATTTYPDLQFHWPGLDSYFMTQLPYLM